jgi:hypothetical protein
MVCSVAMHLISIAGASHDIHLPLSATMMAVKVFSSFYLLKIGHKFGRSIVEIE